MEKAPKGPFLMYIDCGTIYSTAQSTESEVNMFISKLLNFTAVMLISAFLAGCSSTAVDFDNDPDLLTQGEEIPERPGLLEQQTGKKLEKGF